MDLNPDDIVGYRFKQSLRGYAIEEVDELLDRLADQVERMAAEIADLRGKVRVAETQVEATRETEATLQRTLVVAQQAAERNLAEAAAQAEATMATATADAERLRRETEEEAGRVRSEAEADAARTLEQAQELARREVDAARSRVERAAARHAEVLAGIAHHRDALRGQLAALEELALDPPPPPRQDLFAGELDQTPASSDDAPSWGPPAAPDGPVPLAGPDDQPEAEPAEAEAESEAEPAEPGWPGGEDAVPDHDPATPLRVRVHEGHGGAGYEGAPLGSDEREGDGS